MARNVKRRTSASAAELTSVEVTSSPMSDFEKEIYMTVLKGAVVALNVQFPIMKATAQKMLYEAHMKGALCLAAIAVEQYRAIGQTVEEDFNEGE